MGFDATRSSGLAASAAQAGEINGRVTEATGAVGLQGAIVRVSETGQTVSTSRDGSFRLANVPAGDFTLVVDYLGADAQTRSVTLINADAVVETNFALGADVAVEDNILIIGQRGQLTNALNRQRASTPTLLNATQRSSHQCHQEETTVVFLRTKKQLL